MSIATAIPSVHTDVEQDGEELEAWRGLIRAHGSIAKRVESALERAHGLPLRAYEVLQHLAETSEGRMRMSELASLAQLSRSGLTRLVDRLERDGLVMRCSCEHDARGAYACMTDAGLDRLRAAHKTHLAVVREHFLSRFSSRELLTLTELWNRVAPCAAAHELEPARPTLDGRSVEDAR
jgi:DNA-binding MarR family transcriptional regulator